MSPRHLSRESLLLGRRLGERLGTKIVSRAGCAQRLQLTRRARGCQCRLPVGCGAHSNCSGLAGCRRGAVCPRRSVECLVASPLHVLLSPLRLCLRSPRLGLRPLRVLLGAPRRLRLPRRGLGSLPASQHLGRRLFRRGGG